MISEVLGYFPVDFTDKESGKRITGISVFLTEKITTQDGEGYKATKVFLSSWASPFLGKCNVEMNLSGKVVNIIPYK